jgi:hypothetical protein
LQALAPRVPPPQPCPTMNFPGAAPSYPHAPSVLLGVVRTPTCCRSLRAVDRYQRGTHPLFRPFMYRPRGVSPQLRCDPSAQSAPPRVGQQARHRHQTIRDF